MALILRSLSAGRGSLFNMSSTAESTVAEVEAQLEATTRALADAPMLTASQGERIVEKLERLQSQLMEVTPPPSMAEAEARLGLTPATPEQFAELAKHMLPPDGEG